MGRRALCGPPPHKLASVVSESLPSVGDSSVVRGVNREEG